MVPPGFAEFVLFVPQGRPPLLGVHRADDVEGALAILLEHFGLVYPV